MEVGTQVSGIISKIYVDYNSVVKKGQVIAELDKTNLTSELNSARSNMAASQSNLDYQRANFRRYETLHSKGLVSDDEYESARLALRQAESDFAVKQELVNKAQTNLGYAIITAPIDGVILSKAVEEGQTVASNFSTPTLFTIAQDLTDMRVIADVDEADIGQVAEGQKVTFTVDAYPNDEFEGVVRQVRLGEAESSSTTSTSSSTVVTYEVVITADNPDLKLKPRLTANVTIYTMERPNILTIPNKALRFVPDPQMMEQIGITIENKGNEVQGGKRMVWLRQGNTLTPKQITVGTNSSTLTEVTDGLTEGDEIAVDMATTAAMPAMPQGNQNPFMPGPPGRNNKKNGEGPKE